MLPKLLASEVFAYISNYIVKRTYIYVNLKVAKYVLYSSSRYICKLLYSLKFYSVIDDIEYQRFINIYNINKDKVVKLQIVIILNSKFELAQRSTLFLAEIAKLSNLVDYLSRYIIVTSSSQYSQEFTSRRVAKVAVQLLYFVFCKVNRQVIKAK